MAIYHMRIVLRLRLGPSLYSRNDKINILAWMIFYQECRNPRLAAAPVLHTQSHMTQYT